MPGAARRRLRGVDLVGVVALVLVWLGQVAPAAAMASRLHFELGEHETPARMCPGEPRFVALELHNDGDAGWQRSRRDRVAYHWLDADGAPVVFEGARTDLPQDVAPGASVRVQARLVAPPEPGAYTLEWAMVREGERWLASETDVVEVEVAGEGHALELHVEDLAPPSGWGAADRAAVPATIVNHGCAAWSNRFGDALSYRWRDASTGAVEVAEGMRTPLEDLPPGGRARVEVQVQGPPREGTWTLELAAVREHLAWFRAPDHAGATVRIGPSALRWSYVMPDELPVLFAGDLIDVPLRLTNEGTRTWSHLAGDRLSYRIHGSDGRVVEAEGLRTRLAHAVAPGDTIELSARLKAPDEPGPYEVRWEMVREGERWYGPPVAGAEAVAVDVGPPRLAWELVSADAPHRAWAGRAHELEVTLKNVGIEAWSPALGDRVSYRWHAADGSVVVREGERTALPHDVAPGDTVTLAMRVDGPPQVGRHRLELELVREHVTWFGGPRSGPPATFGVGIHRLVDVLLLALGLGVIGLVLVRRELQAAHFSRARRRAAAALDLLAVPVWTATCVHLIGESFVDFGGVGMWPGGRVLTASGAALVAMPILLLPARVRAPVALAGVGVLTLLALADIGYLHFFGSIVPLTALAAVHHLGDASETVGSLMRPEYAWLAALPVSGLVLVLAWPRPRVRAHPRVHALALGVFALAATPAAVHLVRATTGGLGTRVFSEEHNVGRLGLVNAHLFELMRGLFGLAAGPATATPEVREEIEAFYAERAATRASPTEGTGAAAGANVLLVQVEALQGWAVDARVGGEPVMPFLSRAAETDALWFRHVHEQTAQGRTSDAEYLALTSNHPMSVGALCFLRADNRFHTLAHATADAGAATLSAHPYKRGFWNRAVLHPRYGFAESIFRRELGDGPVIGWGLSDAAFFERLVPRLSALPSPFFAFAITLSLHHPYESFPRAFQRLDLGDHLQDTPLGNYLHAMHHVDEALRQLMHDLDAAGLLDHTLVVVYGDHGSRLGEPPEVLAWAGLDAWDPSVPTRLSTVPVFAWVPDGAARGLVGVRDRVGGQIDIAPTVLDLLGRADGLPAAVGGSLLAEGPGFVALANRSAVTSDRLYVARGREIPRGGACFDSVTGAARPREDCDALRARAKQELELSRLVLDHDLQREIGAR